MSAMGRLCYKTPTNANLELSERIVGVGRQAKSLILLNASSRDSDEIRPTEPPTDFFNAIGGKRTLAGAARRARRPNNCSSAVVKCPDETQLAAIRTIEAAGNRSRGWTAQRPPIGWCCG